MASGHRLRPRKGSILVEGLKNDHGDISVPDDATGSQQPRSTSRKRKQPALASHRTVNGKSKSKRQRHDGHKAGGHVSQENRYAMRVRAPTKYVLDDDEDVDDDEPQEAQHSRQHGGGPHSAPSALYTKSSRYQTRGRTAALGNADDNEQQSDSSGCNGSDNSRGSTDDSPRQQEQGVDEAGSSGAEDDGEEGGQGEDDEEEEEEGRKTYSLRDRKKVLRMQNVGMNGFGLQRRPTSRRSRDVGRSRLRQGGPEGKTGARHVLHRLWGGARGHDGGPDLEHAAWKHLTAVWNSAALGDVPDSVAMKPNSGRADGMPLEGLAAGGGKGAPAGNGPNAEITPVSVDPSITFAEVGGLDHYIRALKEMIFLPLVYPQLFERFSISPPRGVLFYGPPGTGKTLVARALAATASRAGRKVAFFMRKGADVLSKWMGESERQLRLLFDEAVRQQPSIIFFDEIDGLAPVRSSKQDQIHSSIVSTLLALMDGLDSRGQVVVIGATNRVDAIDGALRRPGRFDRELLFPLPNLSARMSILDIHTKAWSCKPDGQLKMRLGQLTAGYCGADIKALCTEAALHAMRRCYPQIYETDSKLLVDPSRVSVEQVDFTAALQRITPASHRAAAADARPLPKATAPLLQDDLEAVLERLQQIFPPAAAALQQPQGLQPGEAAKSFFDVSDWDAISADSLKSFRPSVLLRPRLLLCGPQGAGQSHLAPAVLHALEGLPLHSIGLPSLLSDVGARSAEEALVHVLTEARRAAPAVLYLPHLELWWATAPLSLQTTLWTVLADLPSDLPLLLIATANATAVELHETCPEALTLFSAYGSGVYQLAAPNASARQALFAPMCTALAQPPPPPTTQQQQSAPELPLAPDECEREAREAAEEAARAARQAYDGDQAVLRTLRQVLREVTYKLLADKRWSLYVQPVDDPEYWDKVSEPMDLATLLCRVDQRRYHHPDAYVADAALIPAAMQQYITAELQAEDPHALQAASGAFALLDEVQRLMQLRVPQQLRDACDALREKGGPAPRPDGHADKIEEVLQRLEQPAAQQAGGVGTAAKLGGPASIGGPSDPDALSRRIRMEQRERLKVQLGEAADIDSTLKGPVSRTGSQNIEHRRDRTAASEQPADASVQPKDAGGVELMPDADQQPSSLNVPPAAGIEQQHAVIPGEQADAVEIAPHAASRPGSMAGLRTMEELLDHGKTAQPSALDTLQERITGKRKREVPLDTGSQGTMHVEQLTITIGGTCQSREEAALVNCVDGAQHAPPSLLEKAEEDQGRRNRSSLLPHVLRDSNGQLPALAAQECPMTAKGSKPVPALSRQTGTAGAAVKSAARTPELVGHPDSAWVLGPLRCEAQPVNQQNQQVNSVATGCTVLAGADSPERQDARLAETAHLANVPHEEQEVPKAAARAEDLEAAESLCTFLVQNTEGQLLEQLEALYSRLSTAAAAVAALVNRAEAMDSLRSSMTQWLQAQRHAAVPQ